MNKIDIKSLLIGFLSCLCLVLIVGFKSIQPSSATVGTYQGFGAQHHSGKGFKYMLNTITGELYYSDINAWRSFDTGAWFTE